VSDREALASLRRGLAHQEGFAPGELDVLIADRTGLPIEPSPDTRILRAPADTSVFTLRRQAFEASTAPILVVTEDHCVPGPGWVRALVDALESDPGAVAVSGPVHDGLDGDAWDRAAFLCDYANLLPDGVPGTRPVSALPGMNTAYRRGALEAVFQVEPELLDDFWSGALHRRLARHGRFLSTSGADLSHCKRFGRKLALEQRFLQARHVAGRRASDLGVGGRIGWAVAAAALPAAVLRRILPPVRLAATLPPLLALVGAWTLGEVAGAALGPGDALARVE